MVKAARWMQTVASAAVKILTGMLSLVRPRRYQPKQALLFVYFVVTMVTSAAHQKCCQMGMVVQGGVIAQELVTRLIVL